MAYRSFSMLQARISGSLTRQNGLARKKRNAHPCVLSVVIPPSIVHIDVDAPLSRNGSGDAAGAGPTLQLPRASLRQAPVLSEAIRGLVGTGAGCRHGIRVEAKLVCGLDVYDARHL